MHFFCSFFFCFIFRFVVLFFLESVCFCSTPLIEWCDWSNNEILMRLKSGIAMAMCDILISSANTLYYNWIDEHENQYHYISGEKKNLTDVQYIEKCGDYYRCSSIIICCCSCCYQYIAIESWQRIRSSTFIIYLPSMYYFS